MMPVACIVRKILQDILVKFNNKFCSNCDLARGTPACAAIVLAHAGKRTNRAGNREKHTRARAPETAVAETARQRPTQRAVSASVHSFNCSVRACAPCCRVFLCLLGTQIIRNIQYKYTNICASFWRKWSPHTGWEQITRARKSAEHAESHGDGDEQHKKTRQGSARGRWRGFHRNMKQTVFLCRRVRAHFLFFVVCVVVVRGAQILCAYIAVLGCRRTSLWKYEGWANGTGLSGHTHTHRTEQKKSRAKTETRDAYFRHLRPTWLRQQHQQQQQLSKTMAAASLLLLMMMMMCR